MGQEAVEQVPMVYLVLTGLVFLGLLVPWSKKTVRMYQELLAVWRSEIDHVVTMTSGLCNGPLLSLQIQVERPMKRFVFRDLERSPLMEVSYQKWESIDILWNSNPPLVEAFQPPSIWLEKWYFFLWVHQDLNCRQVRKGPLSGTIRQGTKGCFKWSDFV